MRRLVIVCVIDDVSARAADAGVVLVMVGSVMVLRNCIQVGT